MRAGPWQTLDQTDVPQAHVIMMVIGGNPASLVDTILKCVFKEGELF